MSGPFAGVDGGGTRTRAVITDAEGRIVARGEAPGAVASAHRPEAAADAVARAVRRAADEAGAALPVETLWAGLAGARAGPARDGVRARLEAEGLARRVVVGTDAEAAFHDAFGAGPGVLLIAGTGSIVWARGPAGRLARVGGWGGVLGDEGSGYRIGLDALRAVTRHADGRAPAPLLAARVLEALELPDADALVPWAEAASKADVAALTPVVAACAREGEGAAAEILEAGVGALLSMLETALERSGPWEAPAPLALWGGLAWEGGPLAAPLRARLGHREVAVLDRPLDPPLGAARLAAAGADPTF